MRKTAILGLAMAACLLGGCGTEQGTPAVEYRDLCSETVCTANEDFFPIFAYNDTGVIAWDYEAKEVYAVSAGETTVTMLPLFEIKECVNATLIGMDGEDGVWFSVYDDSTNELNALRFDLNGELKQSIPLSDYGVIGVYDFVWDQDQIYFAAVTERDTSCILVFDREFALTKTLPVTDVSKATEGYLPMEAEWEEELEGRDGDSFYEMLFPDGAQDCLQLCKYTDGSIGILIDRGDPFSFEKYVIPCTVDWVSGEVAPRGFFFPENQNIGFEQVCAAINCPFGGTENTDCDLYLITQFGIEEYRFSENDTAMLHPWNSSNMPISPSEPVAVLPDGRLLRTGNTQMNSYRLVSRMEPG